MNKLILLSLASLALARPDVSHLGYNFNSPSGSYLPSLDHSGNSIGGISVLGGLPGSYSPAGGHAGSGSGHGIGIIPDGHGIGGNVFGNGGLGGLGVGGLGGLGVGGLGGLGVGGLGGLGVGGLGGLGAGGIGGLGGGSHGIGQFGTGGIGGQVIDPIRFIGGGHGISDGAVVDSGEQTEIHFYGGDDQQQSRLRIHVAPAPSKNRVLFVKSPDAGGNIIPEIVAPSVPSVDRTVVYVLSKKQEGIGSINIPAAVTQNVVKSRPQVYYIRYKDAQDAERAVADTLSGKSLGSGVKPINDKESFLKSLATGPHGVNGVLGSVGGVHGSGSPFNDFGITGSGGLGVGGVPHSIGNDGGSHTIGTPSGGITIVGGSVPGSSGIKGVVSDVSSGSKYGTPGASGPY
ncbi:hypothetical protein FQA39_LY16410 [Lamprigera yunnana]|nr:hypothetical protein FQA39_LY16410 [Lamprigera yunnana]